MINKIFLLVFLYSTYGLQVIGQSIEKPFFSRDGNGISTYLSEYIVTHGDYGKLRKLCQASCVFVKFHVDINGNVVDVKSNRGTPNIVDSLIRQGILATSKRWVSISRRRYSKLPYYYLIPFIYDFVCKGNDLENTYKRSVENMLQFKSERTTISGTDLVPKGYEPFEPLQCRILPVVFFPEFTH